MATRLTHRQRPDLQSYTILALGRAFAVTGQAALTLAGRRLTVPDRIPYSYDGYAATLTTGTGDVWNVTPAPTWTEGISAPYDLTTTLPSTYTDGGVYSFGYEGTTPPTGLTLSEAGSLDVGTATAATTTGVKFSYYEPGATTTLTLYSQFAGTYPYMATIYPLEGTVPSGQILLSPDDSTFRSNVLSTWPDGSAQVIVGAGRKAVSGGGTTNIKLRPGLASGMNMTTTDLVAIVNTVAVNFGTPLSLTLTNSNHDRIWWANPEVICARYRLPITNKGDMEAVIDVHAFAGGRALVEVVVENAKVNADAASIVPPAAQTYTNATVSVNGTVIATVSPRPRGEEVLTVSSRRSGVTPTAPVEGVLVDAFRVSPPTGIAVGYKCAIDNDLGTLSGDFVGRDGQIAEWTGSSWTYSAALVGRYAYTASQATTDCVVYNASGVWQPAWSGYHNGSRAWYCSAEVNGASVSARTSVQSLFGIEVVHDAESLQSHPWFWRRAVNSTENLQTLYETGVANNYTPFNYCHLRIPGMDGTGGDDEIAVHTKSQCNYFLFGNRYARRAAISTGLALLTANVNWRHTGGEVPTRAQVAGKNTNSAWQELNSTHKYGGNNTADGSHIPSVALVPFLCMPSPCFIELAQKETIWNQIDFAPQSNGAHFYDQTRSRAWRLRNAAITIFLTPDGDLTRKDGYRAMLRAELDRDRTLFDQPWNVFKYLYDPTVNDPSDASSSRPRSQGHSFMNVYVMKVWQHIAMTKVLRNADQTFMEEMANIACVYPCRWFNDAISYEWRAYPYQPTVGVRVGNTLDMSSGSLTGLTREEMSGTMPSAPGAWLNFGPGDYTWPTVAENSGGLTYPSFFFGALCAAVERDVPEALLVWNKIYGTNGSDGGINNLMTWRNGFSGVPQWNCWPRNR